MEPFRTILFAADFSERSREAFRLACSLGNEKTQLIVLHVDSGPSAVETPSVPGELGIPLPLAGDGRSRREGLKAHLSELYVPHRPLAVSYEVAEGVAADEILREAGNAQADLIVLATHGRKGLRRLLAGSVAESVLRRAVCPVLALRSPDLPHPADEIRSVLHPTDFSTDSDPALRVARAIARERGARFVVAHVAPDDSIVDGSVIPVELGPLRKTLEVLRATSDGPDLKYPMETRLGQGDSCDEIVRIATEIGCDLIVMGTHGRTGLHRLLMGSVAEDVLRRASCPVLFVKAPHGEPAAEADVPVPRAVTVF